MRIGLNDRFDNMFGVGALADIAQLRPKRVHLLGQAVAFRAAGNLLEQNFTPLGIPFWQLPQTHFQGGRVRLFGKGQGFHKDEVIALATALARIGVGTQFDGTAGKVAGIELETCIGGADF